MMKQPFGRTSLPYHHNKRVIKPLGITDERHIRIVTEGVLIGALQYKGDVEKLAIISNGAGQLAVFQHGLIIALVLSNA
jgi:hypothetical protein